MKDLSSYAHLLEQKPAKVILCILSAYFIFKAGASAGEFFYYLNR
ncbi:hypothetical protein [Hymenobacter qilianensis]|nr:hypothetical protein [Hymenobacter qilianensis]